MASLQESLPTRKKNEILNSFFGAFGQPSENLSEAKQFHHEHMNKIVILLKTIDPQIYPKNMYLGYTGSTYEKTNVGPLIDLDTMIIMPESTVSVKASPFPGYFYLRPKATLGTTSKYSKIMVDEWISPEKFRQKFYGDIQKCLNQMSPDNSEYKVTMRSSGVSSQQDVYKQDRLLHSVDTIPTLKINGAYYVPKTARQDNRTWRQSMSFDELAYLRSLDTKDKGVRRGILQILKSMKNNKKDSTFKCLPSYHLKTWVMHVSAQSLDKPWKIENLADRVDDVMSYAILTFRKGVLPHFYNEAINLYDGITSDSDTLKIMAKRMERIRPLGGKKFEQFFKVTDVVREVAVLIRHDKVEVVSNLSDKQTTKVEKFVTAVNDVATAVVEAATVATEIAKAVHNKAAHTHNDEAALVNKRQLCPKNGNNFEKFLAVARDTAEAVKVVSKEVVQAYRYAEDQGANNDADQDTECSIQ